VAHGQLSILLRHLQRIVDPDRRALSDSHLLQRFVADRDEAAFEVLLWRHGPMVLNVCRRLLRQEQDVEDAFQATFLTLVRKAGSIGKREAVGSWLYRVAYRVALAVRAGAAGPVRPLHPLQQPAAPELTPEIVWRELQSVLDEEVNRLPGKYRAAFILCYLEGKTNEQAARQLGCPRGTVVSRLARARERLRKRLTQRGLALSSGLLALVLSERALTATPCAPLFQATLENILRIAAGKAAAAAVSGRVTLLTEGVVRAMFPTRMKVTAVVLLVLGLASSGAGVAAYLRAAARPENEAEAQTGLPAAKQYERDEGTRRPPRREPRPRPPVAQGLTRDKLRSKNNLRQLALAILQYTDTYKRTPAPAIYDKNGKALLSWRVALLPFLEEQDLYRRFHLNEPWDSPHNKALLQAIPPIYAPVGNRDREPYATYYQVFVSQADAAPGRGTVPSADPAASSGTSMPGEGAKTAGSAPNPSASANEHTIGAAFEKHRRLRLPEDIPDGCSKTILIIEAGNPVPWTKPEDLPFAMDEPLPLLGGLFTDVINTVLADCSVLPLKHDLDEATLRAAITRNGGEVVDLDRLLASLPSGSNNRVAELKQEQELLRNKLHEEVEELDILRAEFDLQKRKVRLRQRDHLDLEIANLREENARYRWQIELTVSEKELVRAAIEGLRKAGDKEPATKK
jgi:RNA polymerase sigma factor (sigma-70 family)